MFYWPILCISQSDYMMGREVEGYFIWTHGNVNQQIVVCCEPNLTSKNLISEPNRQA
jgi:hypothetical protein